MSDWGGETLLFFYACEVLFCVLLVSCWYQRVFHRENKNRLKWRYKWVFFGDPSEIRTPDTLIKSHIHLTKNTIYSVLHSYDTQHLLLNHLNFRELVPSWYQVLFPIYGRHSTPLRNLSRSGCTYTFSVKCTSV